MVLEMEDGGIDVESFVFNSASQALSAFLQVYYFKINFLKILFIL